ncbi:MAG: LLM class F420-dependent oxidoreductase [Acidimicrobiales bacterium]|nr:LLM class F420-dependent oxidoreductase [Acidimicrobiales bacterium]
MDVCIFVEPQQGAGYLRLSTLARHAEAVGFDGFFVSDHYHHMGDRDPRLGPSDALTTLAGLSRDTTKMRLGVLVCSATFRRPGQLAVMTSEIDQMSGGRFELGLGAGWFEEEHLAMGISFPPLRERFNRLEEQLEILKNFWETENGATFSYEGNYYTLSDRPALPQPIQSCGVPLIIGGGGPRKTPRLAAQFGAEYNLPFQQLDRFIRQRDLVREACETISRDPDDLTYSVAQVICTAENEADLVRRSLAIGRQADELKENAIAGTPEEAIAKIEEYRAAGASKIYLQVWDEDDLDHISLIAEQILPSVQRQRREND